MKNLILFGLVPMLFLAACKKEAKVAPLATTKTNEVVFPSDSASFALDGKTYTLTGASSLTAGNTEANRKVDSVVDFSHYYISGDKDSTFYYETHRFNAPGMGLDISFFKKFATKGMVQSLIYYPDQQAVLFQPGNYKYGTDFTRENATNGVALAVNNSWKTYSDQTLGIPVPISSASENNAHFQILSLKKLAEDNLETQYVVEAKFDATLFDNNGTTKQLSNGYIRMIVAY